MAQGKRKVIQSAQFKPKNERKEPPRHEERKETPSPEPKRRDGKTGESIRKDWQDEQRRGRRGERSGGDEYGGPRKIPEKKNADS